MALLDNIIVVLVVFSAIFVSPPRIPYHDSVFCGYIKEVLCNLMVEIDYTQ